MLWDALGRLHLCGQLALAFHIELAKVVERLQRAGKVLLHDIIVNIGLEGLISEHPAHVLSRFRWSRLITLEKVGCRAEGASLSNKARPMTRLSQYLDRSMSVVEGRRAGEAPAKQCLRHLAALRVHSLAHLVNLRGLKLRVLLPLAQFKRQARHERLLVLLLLHVLLHLNLLLRQFLCPLLSDCIRIRRI